MAKIIIWTGPMSSGKTPQLYYETIRWYDCRQKVMFVVHSSDTEMSGSSLPTNQSMDLPIPKDIPVLSIDKLSHINMDIFNACQVISIDGADAFSDLSQCVRDWFYRYPDKLFLISGLSAHLDIDNHISPTQICELLSYASEYIMLKANCEDCLTKGKSIKTNRNAGYSYRISKSRESKERTNYLSLCRKHFFKRISKPSVP